MAGQVIGTLLGAENIPSKLILQLQGLKQYPWVTSIINQTIQKLF